MTATNGVPPERIATPLIVYTAWGRPDGDPVIFKRGEDPPTAGRVPGNPPDTEAVLLFTIEAPNWETAKAEYYRRLAHRSVMNY